MTREALEELTRLANDASLSLRQLAEAVGRLSLLRIIERSGSPSSRILLARDDEESS